MMDVLLAPFKRRREKGKVSILCLIHFIGDGTSSFLSFTCT